jgi:FHA domain
MVGGKDDLPDFSDGDEPAQHTAFAEDLRLGLRLGQKPWLLVVGGRRRVGMLIEVKNNMTIGRVPPVDVVIDEEGVSRRHARIEIVQGGVVRVTDLDSSNGIRVAGRRVKSHALRDGERLRLGDAVLTLVHFDDNTQMLAANLQASLAQLSK